MAAADARRGERVAKQGFGSIAPSQAVRLMERLIQQERPQVSVVDLDIRRLRQAPAAAKAPLLRDLFARLVEIASGQAAALVEVAGSKSAIRNVISAAAPEARRGLLKDYLAVEMAKILEIVPSELHMNRPMNSLGIDSLMAVEIRNRIESDMPVRVQISGLLEGATADDLIANLLGQLQTEAPQRSAGRAAKIKQELDQMSDEAVRALLEAKRQEARRRQSQ
jgi:hypothetical protein